MEECHSRLYIALELDVEFFMGVVSLPVAVCELDVHGGCQRLHQRHTNESTSCV